MNRPSKAASPGSCWEAGGHRPASPLPCRLRRCLKPTMTLAPCLAHFVTSVPHLITEHFTCLSVFLCPSVSPSLFTECHLTLPPHRAQHMARILYRRLCTSFPINANSIGACKCCVEKKGTMQRPRAPRRSGAVAGWRGRQGAGPLQCFVTMQKLEVAPPGCRSEALRHFLLRAHRNEGLLLLELDSSAADALQALKQQHCSAAQEAAGRAAQVRGVVGVQGNGAAGVISSRAGSGRALRQPAGRRLCRYRRRRRSHIATLLPAARPTSHPYPGARAAGGAPHGRRRGCRAAQAGAAPHQSAHAAPRGAPLQASRGPPHPMLACSGVRADPAWARLQLIAAARARGVCRMPSRATATAAACPAPALFSSPQPAPAPGQLGGLDAPKSLQCVTRALQARHARPPGSGAGAGRQPGGREGQQAPPLRMPRRAPWAGWRPILYASGLMQVPVSAPHFGIASILVSASRSLEEHVDAGLFNIVVGTAGRAGPHSHSPWRR